MRVKNSFHFSVVFMMILSGSLSRLIPHAPNFTAVGAMALFAGATLGLSLWAFLIPMTTLALTDLVFGLHPTMIYVYGAFSLVTLLGALTLKKRSGARLVGITLLSSLLFFFVTNFGVWAAGGFYAPNFSGLMESFTMGIPFLKNQIFGDITYSVLMFAGYELLARRSVKSLT